MKLSDKAFDAAVKRAIARIPREIKEHLDNAVIAIRPDPTPEMLEDLGIGPDEEPPLGVYWGTSLADRSFFGPTEYPDTIFIFKEPLEEMCRDMAELEEEIEITVVHEVAHFLGFSDEELEALGYG